MDRSQIQRQQLLEAVNNLPDEALVELANFLDYLRDKSAPQSKIPKDSSRFLARITGLGHSSQQDVSEQDEKILQDEIDPIHGWNIKPYDLT